MSARKSKNIVSTFFNFAQYKVILAENFELNFVGEWLPTFRKMKVLSPSKVLNCFALEDQSTSIPLDMRDLTSKTQGNIS